MTGSVAFACNGIGRSVKRQSLHNRNSRRCVCRLRNCELYDFLVADDAVVDYRTAWALQRRLRDRLVSDPNSNDALLLLQHNPTFTLGTGSTINHLKFNEEKPPQGFDLVRVERGGEVTYHAPGQLVVYPVLNLAAHKKDLHWYMWTLEEAIIRSLASLGIPSDRKSGLRGVWTGDTKIAAVGVKISRWVTMHGLAINVCMGSHRKGFQHITPCGIEEFGVSEVSDFLPNIDLRTSANAVINAFEELLDLNMVPPMPLDLDLEDNRLT